MKKKTKKEKIEQPSLSSEQLEFLSSQTKKGTNTPTTDEPFDKSTSARMLRYAKKHKFFASIIIIAILSLVATLVLLSVYSASIIADRPNEDDFTVKIGDKKYTAEYEDIMINDIMYIDVTKIANIDDVIISGDATSRKFTLPSLQYARFENESNIAIVDGEYFDMGTKAIIKGNMCLVPIDFISKIFYSGLNIEIDTEKNEITIKRVEIGKNGKESIYEPLGLTTEIVTDVSNVAYEQFGFDSRLHVKVLDPKNDEYLLLVNHSNPLSSSYIPSDLVQLNCDTNPSNPPSYYNLRETPAKALVLMMDAMKTSGIEGLQASSTYRSYKRQEEIVNSYINHKMTKYALSYEAAKNEVLKTSALPGHSEHQTGLCVDFVQGTSSLTNDFENTTAFAWLKDNAHKFGFILRYPSAKESITGYDYEPWHYRFVGRTVASRIYEANICFEEYVALSK